MKNMKRVFKYLEAAKLMAIYFTFIYMWTASCIFLAYNVNNTSANACFYGGVAIGILHLATAPIVKRKLGD